MAHRRRTTLIFTLLTAFTAVGFVADMATGSVDIAAIDIIRALSGRECDPTTATIVCDIRLLKTLSALLAGMALSVSGLQMQTLFRNPLAGPYVLGISSGAGLGVAIFILAAGSTAAGVLASFGIAGAAWIGSASILAIVAIAGRRLKDIMVILILGMMLSSGIGAVVQILQYLSDDEALKSFVVWTMGTLGNVTSDQLLIFLSATLAGLLLAAATVKPLNLLLLGEDYAKTMGLNINRSRTLIIISTTLLAGTVTAFCGPIGFIGLAIPHVARAIFDEADHRILLPGSALLGALITMTCDIVSKEFALPINAITALLGIPIVVWVVFRNRSMTAR